jgi:hypothetical protein
MDRTSIIRFADDLFSAIILEVCSERGCLTAEIAIMNKTAVAPVAPAADSAVTISAGSDKQKIFACA